jgi:hypothetical protein
MIAPGIGAVFQSHAGIAAPAHESGLDVRAHQIVRETLRDQQGLS